MNFYRPKYVTCKKTESGEHMRCPRDMGARPVRVGAPSTLVEASSFPDYFLLSKILKYSKTEENCH